MPAGGVSSDDERIVFACSGPHRFQLLNRFVIDIVIGDEDVDILFAGDIARPRCEVVVRSDECRNLVRSWIFDLEGTGIRVNVVSPGPHGRVGAPEEIGKAVRSLATEESSFAKGAELFIDGGKAQI